MKKVTLIISLLSLLLLGACSANDTPTASTSALSASSQAPAAQVVKLTAEEAYARMADNEEAVVLDVRTAEEYAEKHIPGAILIPNEEIGSVPPQQLPALDAEILVYCRSGNRSAQAAQKLVDLGYTNVYDFGGIKDWPYETEAGEFVG